MHGVSTPPPFLDRNLAEPLHTCSTACSALQTPPRIERTALTPPPNRQPPLEHPLEDHRPRVTPPPIPRQPLTLTRRPSHQFPAAFLWTARAVGYTYREMFLRDFSGVILPPVAVLHPTGPNIQRMRVSWVLVRPSGLRGRRGGRMPGEIRPDSED